MSGGFLSKARLKVEHTSKISLGEFKLLGGILSNEKTLLNTHIRSSSDGKKAAAALDEWAQAEGVDLADTLGKVAKLLGNDLARAEEEYAEHLNSYRLYFKGLRDREEKFSALKKNKHALQGRIDSTEKKLAKMSPENKELANTQNRLMELRNEMSGMEYAVMNEESALSDHRRQTARAAVNHKLAALCQLGEKLSIIGELGKLLVSEIPLERTEPGHDRAIYTSHERTQQIYGEAQTCLHGVNFDLSNSGNMSGAATNGVPSAAPQLPLPSAHEYDRSYDFDQEADQRDSYEQAAQQQQQITSPLSTGYDSNRISQGSQPSVNQGVSLYPIEHSEQAISAAPVAIHGADETPSRSYQPLATPTHVDMESEFSDAVNASWREQQEQGHNGYYNAHRPGPAGAQGVSDVRQEPIAEQEETATVSSVPRAVQASQTAVLNSPAGYTEVAGHQGHSERQTGESAQDTRPATAYTHAPPPPAAIAAAYGEEENDEQDKQSLGGGVRPFAAPTRGLDQGELASTSAARSHASPPLPSLPAQEAELAEPRYQGYTPQGDDLYGTGLYGNSNATGTSEEHLSHVDEPESYDHAQKDGAPSHLASQVQTGSTSESPVESSESRSARLDQQQAFPGHSAATSPQSATLPLSVSEIVSRQQSQRDATSSSYVHQAPPPLRPAGPSQSQAPPAAPSGTDAVLPSASPLPFPGSPAAQHDESLTPSGRKRTGTSSPPPSASASQSNYQTIASSQSAHRQPSVPTPSSPTRAKPVKQSSYRSEQRQSMTKRQDSSDYAQRSSIAYLNDTPHIEPPMRAPPPVTSLGPLPSTSPYFNSYATLRTSSYGKPDPLTPSLGDSRQDSTASNGRPKVASRKSDGKSSRGMGVDMRASQGPASSGTLDKPLLQQPRANAHASTYGSRDFSYGINEPGALAVSTGSGGRKLNAGAFRRVTPNRESSYLSSQGSGADGGISPAQRLRDEWRNSQSQLDSLTASQREQQEQQVATPYATPVGTPSLAAGLGDVKSSSEDTSRYSTATEGMYDDAPHSSQRGNSNFTHRTSAIDAPVDVLPHEASHSTLRNLAADEQQVFIRDSTSPSEEETQPLNLQKRSMVGVQE